MSLNYEKLTRAFSKNRIYSAIFLLMCISPVVLLTVQYFRMRHAISRLLEYQEDYRSYAMTLKRIIRDKTKISSDDTSTESKKKIFTITGEDFSALVGSEEIFSSDCDEPLFRVVNRSSKHLYTNARTFARKHKLEAEYLAMFKDLPQLGQGTRKGVRKKRKRQFRPVATVQGLPLHMVAMTAQEVESREKHDFICAWPLKKGTYRLSSGFGPRRIARRGWRLHPGLDLAACSGTPVYAAAAGTVIQAGWFRGYGNCVTISHGRKYRTRYGHLKKILVKVGTKLPQGGLVGQVGNTGNVVGKNGLHLHFEIHSFGKPINPMLCLSS